MPTHFDSIIIGAGQAGPTLAGRLTQSGRTVAVYGVTVPGGVSVDMKAVKARKEKIVAASRDGLEAWLRGMKNCTVFIGNAHFESPTEIRVGDDLLSAKEIFLNVGGRAVMPDFPGVDSVPWMNNVGILELDTLPRHLIVVGGSYVGLEFAQIYRRFGSEVTVIEKSS